jgi:5-methylcytosine-specific restriction endonuclease McrA
MNLLEERVLVLNKLWQAINVCSIRRAVCFLYTGHAKVVDSQNGNYETYDFSNWVKYSENILSSNNANIKQKAGENNGAIHTTSYSLKPPHIIILSFYSGYPNLKIKLSRENIYKRDKYTCQYCGKKLDQKQLNIDHIIPRHRGGKTAWANVVSCCLKCNLNKGGKTLQEANMKPLKKPRAPFRYPLQNLHFEMQNHKSWSHFLDFNKWNVEIGDNREQRTEDRVQISDF